jgi:hypothetical protein
VEAQALGPNAKVSEVVSRLAAATEGEVAALRDSESVVVVAVPAEQYLELVTAYIRDRHLSEVNLDGRIAPSDATLSRLGVEQVDPRDTWVPGEGYNATKPPVS